MHYQEDKMKKRTRDPRTFGEGNIITVYDPDKARGSKYIRGLLNGSDASRYKRAFPQLSEDTSLIYCRKMRIDGTHDRDQQARLSRCYYRCLDSMERCK